jgi:MFS family permease
MTWPSLAAPVIGPPLGGFITTYASWEWIFLLNLPLGILGLVAAAFIIPNEKGQVRAPFDFVGFLLAASALVLLLYGLESLGRTVTEPWIGGALAAGGVLLGFLAIGHFRAKANPLLDLAPLAVQTFAVTALGAGTLFRVAIGATPFLLPLFFQLAFGLDPFLSGMLVLAYMGGNLVMKAVTTRILRRFGFRTVLIGNGLIVGLSIAAFAFVSAATPMPLIVVFLIVAGFCRSMQFTGLSTLAFADVPPPQRGSATTLSAMSQQVGQTLGVASGALILALTQALGSGGGLDAVDFHIAFLATGILAIVSSAGFVGLPRDAGADVSGHGGAVQFRRNQRAAK